MGVRIEKDYLGTKEVPEDAYYGIHTTRSIENFPISSFRTHPRFVEAYAMIKKAAALTNMELGLLKAEIGQPIVQACDEVLSGGLRDQFVVDVFQMGAGTSFNMNMNEVLANRAIEIKGGHKGDYSIVNPNDHVNMGQSTNDTFPTAMRLSARLLLDELFPVLDTLHSALMEKAKEFDDVLKAGRTHLQDAVPIRLGQEFAAYACTISKCKQIIEQSSHSLEELGIGGSAVGTGLNTHPEYRFRMIEHLRKLTCLDLKNSPDMREAMQSNLPIAEVSSSLRLLALELIRIANDLRLLNSGPTTGFAEIDLPSVQPGSSIMPGKVNPSMVEMLNMVAFQIVGNDLTISMAVQAGQLELNVMMPVMIFNLLMSIEILKGALRVFTEKCVVGIRANVQQCRRYAETTLALGTALNRYIGYSNAAEVVKEAMKTGKTIPEIVAQKRLLPSDKLREILDPKTMTEPGIPGPSEGK